MCTNAARASEVGASKQKRKRAKMNVLNLHSLMNSRTREAEWELKRLNNMRPNQTKINQQLRDLSFDFFSVYTHFFFFFFFSFFSVHPACARSLTIPFGLRALSIFSPFRLNFNIEKEERQGGQESRNIKKYSYFFLLLLLSIYIHIPGVRIYIILE